MPALPATSHQRSLRPARLVEEADGDWSVVLVRLDADHWLTDEQRAHAVAHAGRLARRAHPDAP